MTIKRSIPDSLRKKVLSRDGFRCRYCGTTVGPFHMDHVFPESLGGPTTYDNLVTACATCNHRKHAKIGVWPLPIVDKAETSFEDGQLFHFSVYILFTGVVLIILWGFLPLVVPELIDVMSTLVIGLGLFLVAISFILHRLKFP